MRLSTRRHVLCAARASRSRCRGSSRSRRGARAASRAAAAALRRRLLPARHAGLLDADRHGHGRRVAALADPRAARARQEPRHACSGTSTSTATCRAATSSRRNAAAHGLLPHVRVKAPAQGRDGAAPASRSTSASRSCRRLAAPLPSLQVGLSTLDSYMRRRRRAPYSRSISWTDATTPLYKLVEPAGRSSTQIVSGADRRRRPCRGDAAKARKSVLDFVARRRDEPADAKLGRQRPRAHGPVPHVGARPRAARRGRHVPPASCSA